MYKLNYTDLALLGFTPVRQEGSDLALSGFLDMPARLGKTFHDWADENGIEPYVAVEEIFFGGRDLKLQGVITGATRQECLQKLNLLYNLADAKSLVPLDTSWGSYQVYVNAPVVADYLGEQGLGITIPFREPAVAMTGILPATDGAAYGIDGISFEALGGAFIELTGDRRNRTAPKPAALTAFGKEGYQPTRLSAPEMQLKLAFKQPDQAALRAKVTALMGLMAAPGIHQLKLQDGPSFSFFVKDGFTVTHLHFSGTPCMAVIDCKLTGVYKS